MESERKRETLRFFNMLNEPERSQAIANFDEGFSQYIPKCINIALREGFSWDDSLQGTGNWLKIHIDINDNIYPFKQI